MTACPCCQQVVAIPSLETIIAERGIEGHAAAVLETLWRGRGLPVMAERIFDAMYADDPDGGPSPSYMYRTLSVAFAELGKRLEGTGITIVDAGYHRGHRLKMVL